MRAVFLALIFAAAPAMPAAAQIDPESPPDAPWPIGPRSPEGVELRPPELPGAGGDAARLFWTSPGLFVARFGRWAPCAPALSRGADAGYGQSARE